MTLEPAPSVSATDVATTDSSIPTPSAPDAGERRAARPSIADLSPADCAAALASRFPALFAATPPLPVKLRIHVDIQHRAPNVFTRKSLSTFLHRYTTSTAYLRALAASSQRFDLDGQAVGEVSAEHREAAGTEVARRRAIVRARQQAGQQAGPGVNRPAGGDATGTPAGDQPRSRNRRRHRGRPKGDSPTGLSSTAHPGQATTAAPGDAPSQTVAPGMDQAADQQSLPPSPTGPDRGPDQRPASAADPRRPSPHPRPKSPRRPPRPTQTDAERTSGQAPGTKPSHGKPRPHRPPGPAGEFSAGKSARPGERPGPTRSGPGSSGPGRRPDRQDGRRHPASPASHPRQEESTRFLDPASRERQALLRAFESSPLSKANFCALKGIAESALDEQIALARKERASR